MKGSSTMTTVPPGIGETAAPVQETHSGSDLPCGDWDYFLPKLTARMENRHRLLMGLGFDGILAPTVSHPDKAVMADSIRALLNGLTESPRIKLAFLSGRSVRDLQNRIGLTEAFYVGNDGAEVRGPGFATSDGLAGSWRSDLVDAFAFLTKYSKRLKGILIEDKGLSITAHWRMADTNDRSALRELMQVIIRGHPRLHLFAGEECWGLRARASWNKCDALLQILARLRLS